MVQFDGVVWLYNSVEVNSQHFTYLRMQADIFSFNQKLMKETKKVDNSRNREIHPWIIWQESTVPDLENLP